jgi:hypothetical protein
MPRAAEIISKAEFGRRIGVSRPRVSQLAKDGLPVTADGKVDFAKAKRWVDRNLDQHRRFARKPDAFPAPTTSETRSAKLGWEAQLRELEFRKRSNELVDRAAAERAIFERANVERDRWLGWIPRAVSQIAAEAEIDPKLFGTLDRLVRDHLTQLAATPLKVSSRWLKHGPMKSGAAAWRPNRRWSFQTGPMRTACFQKRASEPGPWRTDRTPYLRDVMDTLSASSPVERVVFMKGAQLGATEAGLNWVGYVIANAPGLMLYVMPTTESARRNVRTRIDPLIETTPAVRSRVTKARSRDPGIRRP